MEALSSVGNWISSGAGKGILGLGTMLGGGVQNLLAARQANQKQKFVQDLITNPAKFNQLVSQTEQPLSKGLTTDVERQVDATMAQKGLGSSPAVMGEAYAQGLAPYELQQQQMAINSLLQRLGAYTSTPTMAPVNVGPMLQALMMKNPTGATDPANAYNYGIWSGGSVGDQWDPNLGTPGSMPGTTWSPVPEPTIDTSGWNFGGQQQG